MSNQKPHLNVWAQTQKKILAQTWQFLVTLVVIFAISYDWDTIDVIKLAIFALAIHASILWRYYYKKYHAEFMHNYATANNLQYQPTGNSEGRHGKLFSHDKKGKLSNLVSGSILGLPSDLFNYSFETSYGKNTVMHTVTALQINFPGLLPHFTVLERNESIDSILRWRTGEYEHELEGDFYKYFKLYVSDLEEIEILEILTPEIMAFMIDEAKHLSFEFAENQLFIYQDHYIVDSVELDKFNTLARMLVSRLQKRISRLHDDIATIRSVARKS